MKKRKGHVSAEQLAKNWGISLQIANQTIDATTQRAVRDFSNVTGEKRLKPFTSQLNYKRRDCKMYTDTMFSKVKSLDGNTCAQVYVTGEHAIAVYPLKSKKDAWTTLKEVFTYLGAPAMMISDNAKELTLGEFKKFCDKTQVPIRTIEPYIHNQNMAEAKLDWAFEM